MEEREKRGEEREEVGRGWDKRENGLKEVKKRRVAIFSLLKPNGNERKEHNKKQKETVWSGKELMKGFNLTVIIKESFNMHFSRILCILNSQNGKKIEEKNYFV